MVLDLKSALRSKAMSLGFDQLGVTRPDAVSPKAAQRLESFLAAGRHGDMAWMSANAERRGDPRVLWPEARSVIMLGTSYAPDGDPLAPLSDPKRAVISVYATRTDYHDVLKARSKRLAEWLATETGAAVKIFVDTAPLMEKPLAAEAGLGWQGKHTNLVSREHGSWLFLSAILSTADIEPDPPMQDHCGACRRCLDVCPTNAFPEPYQLDARRCIAYLTIEHKGHIDEEFRPLIGNRIFGCDDCLAVCPWNKFARATREGALAASERLSGLSLADMLGLDDESFRRLFKGTPVKRTGRDRIIRNALIAAGNARDPSNVPAVERLLADAAPIVRAMAVWALGRLLGDREYARARDRALLSEPDIAVRTEWSRRRP